MVISENVLAAMLCQHFQLRESWVNTIQKICQVLLREYKLLALQHIHSPTQNTPS